MEGEPMSLEGMFGAMRSEYASARDEEIRRVSRGLPIAGASGDFHYRNESYYMRLVEIGRHFFRTNSIVKQGVRRLTANVIQDGFTLDIQTGVDDWNKRLGDWWLEWSEESELCDAAGEYAFGEMEDMAFQATVVDGDILSVPLTTGHLRWYEGHRLRTPNGTKRNVQLGVLLDEKFRRRLEYWLTKEDVDPWQTVDLVGDITPIKARDAKGNRQVFHIYHPERFSQTRGVTAMEPIVPWCSMHEQIQFAKLVQQKVVSCYTLFRSKAVGWKPQGPTGDTPTPTREDYMYGMRRMMEQVYPGQVIDLEPGESIEGFSPNVPNPEFFQQALMILTFIAINFDLPLAVLLLDPSKTNFSGWRGAIDQARIRFRKMQTNLRRRFHREVWRWKVRQWIVQHEDFARAVASEKINPFGHEWHLPTWSYIEPLTDAQADDLIIRRGLNSKRRTLARRNLDYDDVTKELFKESEGELREAMRIASTLNKEFAGQEVGRPLDFREVRHWTLANGASLAFSAPLDEEAADPAKEKPEQRPAKRQAIEPMRVD